MAISKLLMASDAQRFKAFQSCRKQDLGVLSVSLSVQGPSEPILSSSFLSLFVSQHAINLLHSQPCEQWNL
ncbi:hypothetical protein SCA6_013528 [Theobroma cacao]